MNEVFYNLNEDIYIKNFGGSTIIFSYESNDYVIMSARDKSNKSRLLLGILKNNYIEDLNEIVINDNNGLLDNSYGISYPFIQKNNKNNNIEYILFFTEWYKSNGLFKNRLCVSKLVYFKGLFQIFNLQKIGGQFENAGAIRILKTEKKEKGKVFIPFFKDNNQFEYNIYYSEISNNNISNPLSLIHKSFIPVNLPFKRSSCFTEFFYKNNIYCIFCARDDNNYSIYIIKEFKSNNKMEIIKKYSYEKGLCYPYLNSIYDPEFFIASKGRYGDEGLVKIQINL